MILTFGIFVQDAVRQDAGAGARDVEIEFVHGGRNAVVQIRAAGRRERMHVNDRIAAVELLPHGIEVGIARPAALIVVGVDADAVGLQRVEAVFDFLHHAVDIGQRHAGEQAEALGMFRHHLGAVVVAGAHGRAALFGVVVENVAHLRHGQHGDGDVELVHLLQRLFGRPAAAERVRLPRHLRLHGPGRRAAISQSPGGAGLSRQGGRHVMMMDVDATGFGRGFIDKLSGKFATGTRRRALRRRRAFSKHRGAAYRYRRISDLSCSLPVCSNIKCSGKCPVCRAGSNPCVQIRLTEDITGNQAPAPAATLRLVHAATYGPIL